MLLRLIITLFLIVLAGGLFGAGRRWHRRAVAGRALLAAQHGRPTILYFRSDDCAVCPAQSAQLETLRAAAGGGLHVQTIDVLAQPDMARQFRVLSLPTTILLNGEGEVKEINYGLTPWPKLRLQLQRTCGPAAA